MAISTVQVEFNGVWYSMARVGSSNTYRATVTAPTAPVDGVPVVIRAVNSGGYQAEYTTAVDVVWETVPPVIAISSPSAGGWYADALTPVVFTLTDEEGGSGVDLASLAFVLDGVTLTSTAPGMVCTAAGNGYSCVYTPPEALSEGAHTVTITVSDLAGNAAAPVTLAWNVDTQAPALVVTNPPGDLTTNNPALTIEGTAADASSGLSSVTINGQVVTLSGGSFSWPVTLTEGQNTFTVVATDALGHTSTITRSVLLDTVAPVFVSVTIQPDMSADPLGGQFVITVNMQPPAVTPAAPETVTGTVNGDPLTLTEGPAYTWTATVPRAASNTYAVDLTATDTAGNSAGYQVTFPCGLGGRWDWTPPEYLNAVDLNRIERNTEYVYAWLQQQGYGAQTLIYKTDWTKQDIPLWSDIQRIRQNVDYLQECFFAIPGWMEIVYNNTVDAGQMNAFEWDLHLLDLWLSRLVSFLVYSGTIYSGMWPG